MMLINRSCFLYFVTMLVISASCSDSNPVASPQVTLVSDPATFTRSGSEIIIRGIIQTNSLSLFNAALGRNPSGVTVVLENVPGTDDTNASFAIGRRIRSAGIDTHIPADGVVASGGTDIFVSGRNRTVGEGAFIGVHSWDSNGIRGIDLPESNPLHLPFVAYYGEMGLPSDFYWFAVRSASPGSVHWMTDSELTQFNLIEAQVP